jgi:hypothetical protein
VAERWSQAELVRAGWSEAELEWEGLGEAASDALGAGDAEAAKTTAGAALRIARERFEAADPRLATSLVLQALALSAADAAAKTAHLLEDAERIWSACDPWIERLTAPRTARSSMFHMRMEQRHRDTYEERWRVKWAQLAGEARARLAALERGAPDAAASTAAAARWRRERPAMLNDTRKLMAAVLLMPDVPSSRVEPEGP